MSNPLSPLAMLATSMQAQPGVYALLLGSGVSTGAGVPTGWGVVTELVRRASEQAARMIPGSASYKTLDKISYLQHIAEDPAQPHELRQQATTALERIDAGNPVDPLYRQIREQADTARGDRDADLHQLAADALARVKHTTPKRRTPRPTPAVPTGSGPGWAADIC